MQKITKEQLTQRLHEARKEKRAIEEKSRPLRDKLDAEWKKVEAAREQWHKTKKEILPDLQAIEAPIADLSREISMLVKATGGRSLSVPTAGTSKH
jgi:predicted  nucleic acid-binding Zn-ribbon protein